MKKISKPFFLGSVAIGLGIAGILIVLGSIEIHFGSRRAGLEWIEMSWIPMLYGGIVLAVLWYKMWAAIQDGYARTTPGEAIGFLFIPIFNIYWMFQVIWGYAKDFNKYIERHAVKTQQLPEGLFLTYVILSLTSWIPVIGLMLMIANYFIGLVLVSKICDGINAIRLAPALSAITPVSLPKHAEPTVKKWTTISFIFSGLYALIAILLFSSNARGDQAIAWAPFIVCILFLIGGILARIGDYSNARVFWLIGGILGFPVGIVMIAGSNKIKQVSHEILTLQLIKSGAFSSSEQVPEEFQTVDSCIGHLANHGCKVKTVLPIKWKITEPMGGRVTIESFPELQRYAQALRAYS